METRMMDLLRKCNHLKVFKERQLTPERAELVILNQELPQWEAVIAGDLGPALKAAGVKPTEEHLKLTEQLYGVNEYQTLFYKKWEDAALVTMFWPWSDNEYVTLHMAIIKEAQNG